MKYLGLNFVSITVAKTAGASSGLPGYTIPSLVCATSKVKYRQLFRLKGDDGDGA
jgi:hypothetical protein